MSGKHLKRWMTTNRPYKRIFVSYYKFTSSHEKVTDVWIPLFLAAAFLCLTLIKKPTYDDFHAFTSSLVTVVVTVLSILAGFNVASMAVIGASPGRFVKDLALHKDDDDRSYLEGLMSMFAWAVLVQLLELVLCMIYFGVDNLFVNPNTNNLIIIHLHIPKISLLVPFVSVGIFLTLHSIILSMRNVAGLFGLILKTMQDGEEKTR